MFMSADIVVQAVMVGLVFASVVTWTVWLAKNIELLAARAGCVARSRPSRTSVRCADAAPGSDSGAASCRR